MKRTSLLIGITGPALSGKNTMARHLFLRHGFQIVSFSDPLRAGITTMFDLQEHHFRNPEKDMTIEWIGKSPRELLQTLGTEWGRDLVNRQIWCVHMHRRIRNVLYSGKNIVIPDVQFIDDARLICSLGGKIWRVIRPGAETMPHRTHSGEQEQQRIVADQDLINDGTIDDLKKHVTAAYLETLDEQEAFNPIQVLA